MTNGVDISSVPELISQACVVPFRRSADGVEICLITSLKKGRWILPKGIIDPGETREQTALKEALEEAGLQGQIVGEPLGEYEDFKWGSVLRVTVLLMEVTGCDDEWPEADSRRRQWVSGDDAVELVSKRVLREFIEAAMEQIETN